MKILFNFLLMITTSLAFCQVDQEVWMQARMNGTLELDNGATTNFWGYSTYTPPTPGPKVFLPGPVLRFNQGDSVVVHFLNNSPEDHTIHFHGLDVIQGMDGVPNTSMAVEPNTIFDYGFRCTHAGNFMYHCHVLTSLHLAMGMYGMVIVDPDSTQSSIYEGGPQYAEDYTLMCSEINLNWNDNPISPGLFTLYEADYLMINGKSGSQLHDGVSDIQGSVNENIALRLANIGYGSVTFYFPEQLDARAYMSDGRVLPNSFNCDSLTLFPGERYSVIVNSSVALIDSIYVEYTDLRTGIMLGENFLPVNISGANLNSVEFNKIIILGNPVDNHLKIQNKMNTIQRVELSNLFGQHVKSMVLKPGLNKFEFSFPSGIYLLKLENGHIIRFMKK